MRDFFIRNERGGVKLETPVRGMRVEDALAAFARAYPRARILGARYARQGEAFREKAAF